MNFIKAIIIIMIFSLTASCASFTPISDRDKMEVEPHQERFALLSEGKVTIEQVKSIPISIVKYDEGTDTVGTCYPWGPFAYITLNEKWWFSNHDYIDREQLVFHEIAHCLLGSHHTMPTGSANFSGQIERLFFKLGIIKKVPGYLNDLCPSSYMHPILIGSDCINKHYDYYIDELFGRVRAEEYMYVYGR